MSIWEVLGGELERRIDDALVDVVGAEVSVTSMDIVYAWVLQQMDTKELRNKGNKFTNVPVLMMIDDFNCCRLVILTLEPIGQAWTFFSQVNFNLTYTS